MTSRLLIGTLVGLAVTFASPASSLAAKKYQEVEQITNSFNFLLANSVAVNDHNGHIYVADSGSGQVDDFVSATDTSPTVWTGSTTHAGSFGGHVAVAVDNTTGDVYVADREHAVIDKFDQNGNLITAFGDTTPAQNGQLAGLKTPAGSFRPPETGYSSFGIAVDQANHDLYAIDARHSVVDVFDENGGYLRQITATPSGLYREGGEYASGLAVNSAGTVYVADWTGPGLVFQFDSSGNYVRTLDGSNTPDGNFSSNCSPGCDVSSVATEDATEKVFVGNESYSDFDVFDSMGNLVPPQGFLPSFGYVTGTAVDQGSGKVYLSAYSYVAVLAPFIVPDITVGSPSSLTATSAVLNGHVDPASGEGGGPVTDCHFEFISNTQFHKNTENNGAADAWGGATDLPCEQSLPYTSGTNVTATATGLTPGTEYHERLIAANSEAFNTAVGENFATVGRYVFANDIGSAGSGAGQFKEPADVAVDDASGDIYVADTGNHRVVKLDSSGNFLAAWGWGVSDGSPAAEVCTSGCQAGVSGAGLGQFAKPVFVAVDNSNGPSAGDVYVGDTANNVVQKFDPAGHLVTGFGSGGAESHAGGIEGVAVGPAGNLIAPTGSPSGIAVDSLGTLYTGMLAIDTSNNDLFYSVGNAIQLYPTDAGCTPKEPYIPCPPSPFGFGHLHSATGAGFDPSSKTLYVANTGDGNIAVFKALQMPEVKTEAVTALGLTSATLAGSVDPNGAGTITDCHFEYGLNVDYGQSAPCSQSVSPSGVTQVTAQVSGLQAFGTYHYRLVATAANDYGLASRGEDRTVTASEQLVPTVSGTSFSNLTSTSVTMNAQITPNFAPTIFRFQYGPQPSYGSQTLSSESIGEDGETHLVSIQVSGLQPATIYHFRVFASNFNGNAAGPDFTFTTPSLPVVDDTASSALTTSSATLSASLRPGYRSTTYHFDYGRTLSYGSQTAESAPVGSDNGVYPVTQALGGLAPETTYHYRIVATNEVGATKGPDESFTTPPNLVPSEHGREETQSTCKKGFVHKHGHCVKKSAHTRRHHKGRPKNG